MKTGALINLSNDSEKLNLIYQNLVILSFQKKFDINIEVIGLKNEENILTKEDIQSSDVFIIISDEQMSDERFDTDKVVALTTDEAAYDVENAYEKIVQKYKEYSSEKTNENTDTVNAAQNTTPNTYGHLINGANAVIPLLVTGGIFNFLVYFLEITSITGGRHAEFFTILANCLLWLVLPVLCGTIAYSIGGKAALIPGILGGIFSNTSCGYIGAVLIGTAAGYFAKLFDKYCKIKEKYTYFKDMILLPLLGSIIISMLMYFIVNPAAKMAINWTIRLVKELSEFNLVLSGALIGIFTGLDLNGAFSAGVSKAAYSLVGIGVFTPQACIIAASMVPALGAALAAVLCRNKYHQDKLYAGNAGCLMGLIGIPQGAVSFVLNNPIRIIPCVALGCGITGVLTAAFGSHCSILNGGIFALTKVGGTDGVLGISISVLVGVVVTAFLIKYFKE